MGCFAFVKTLKKLAQISKKMEIFLLIWASFFDSLITNLDQQNNQMTTTITDIYTHQLDSHCAFELVKVQSGTFLMGSEAEDAFGREKPEHPVYISKDFYIGLFPVTQQVWKKVMNGQNPAYFKGDQRPLEQVSWTDIVDGGQDKSAPESFLKRLNQFFPATGKCKGFSFRLPTEAEWEYAAKGGHLAKELLWKGNKVVGKAATYYTAYAGSDKLKEVAWFSTNAHGETKVVGQKLPNDLGIFDMCGNVWEWCWDCYDSSYYKKCFENGIVENPIGPMQGASRVVRGGSWADFPRFCRLACRYSYHPSFRLNTFGFRLVLSPQ